MGGLRIDLEGRVVANSTGEPIPGLWAAGEVVGGVHGSNRLGGNSLTECVVYGRRVGDSVAKALDQKTPAASAGMHHTSHGRGAVRPHCVFAQRRWMRRRCLSSPWPS
jgi:succinate dehydrogenase/fumarate reductase flavoprotein subunit